MKVLIAVPAFNCERQIVRVIDRLSSLASNDILEILIVDNMSTDETIVTATNAIVSLAAGKISLVQNQQNVGLGGTHKNVLDLCMIRGYTHVVVLHGDDQADAHEITNLIETSRKRGGCTVLGSRFMFQSRREGYDLRRVMGNLVLNVFYSIRFGRVVRDLGSGLNLLRVSDVTKIGYHNFDSGMTFNFDLLVGLIRSRAEFCFVPITWRESDQVSNARNLRVFVSGMRRLVEKPKPLLETSRSAPKWKVIV